MANRTVASCSSWIFSGKDVEHVSYRHKRTNEGSSPVTSSPWNANEWGLALNGSAPL